MKFWTQSFLIGVPKIIVGFRDNNGFLQSIQEFKTLEIPTMVRTDMWDATVCLNFANKFFEWLKTVVIIDNPRSSYTISFEKPFREIHVTFAGEVNPVLADRHIKSNV
nr:2731_t:CDS:2 [Entrophospora candida]